MSEEIIWPTFKQEIRMSESYGWHTYHDFLSIQDVINSFAGSLELKDGQIVDLKDREGNIHKFKLSESERVVTYMKGVPE